ncbi:MAG: hypothetical protein Q4G62_07935 [Pseudomonadota bacterium]|nr:hypothetical protein [Pseudomonadota bacterium]
MSWDALQREVLAELGHELLRPHVPGSEPLPPPDADVVRLLAKALGIEEAVLLDAGIVLPARERLREAAVKRALWPSLRPLRAMR